MANGLRVLYAEDDPHDADLTRTHFQQEAPDLELEIVGTGEECLQRLQQNFYDVLLLGQQLPDTDIIEFLRKFILGGFKIPVVMITGSGCEELVVSALRTEASDYIAKEGNYVSKVPVIIRQIVADRFKKGIAGALSTPRMRRILYVENSPVDTELTLKYFNETAPNFITETAQSCRQAMEFLVEARHFDLILTDLRMPDKSGLEFLAEARHQGIFTPFIIITEKGDEETAAAAMKLGACDYIVKRENYLLQLPYVIENAVARQEMRRTNQKLLQQIAERKRIEEELRESETKYRTLVEQLPAVTYIAEFGQSGPWLYVSPQIKSVLGFEPEEVMAGMSLWNRQLHPADRERVLAEEGRSRETGLPFLSEYRMLTKDGRVRWLHDQAEVVRNESGTPLYLHGIVTDITERKQGESKIQTYALHQAVVAEVGQMALTETDLSSLMDRVVERVSDALQVEYCKVLELLPAGDALLLRAGVGWKQGYVGKGTVGAGRDSQAGFTLLSSDPVIVEDLPTETRFNGPPLLYDHGVISGISTIIHGKEKPFGVLGAHTSRKRTFTEDDVQFLRAVANILGGAISKAQAEEDRKQLEEQLRQMQKMEAVGQLAGGMAHDFNNILMAITSYAELLLMKLIPSDPIRNDVSEIHKAAQHGASLTRQLLAFSRKQIMEPTVLDLNEVIKNMEGMLRRLIEENVELIMNLDPQLDRTRADRGQIEQVIINLAVNARDAMPRGGQLKIETWNVTLSAEFALQHPGIRPGRYVQLKVSDSGHGMNEATKDRIFEPFFTTKRTGEGTGLGLATVYGIIQQSEGHIQVKSEPGKGTTFAIYLPQHGAQQQEIDFPVTSRAASSSSRTILLVDDNESVRTAIAALLEMKGYQILAAGSGKEALKLAGNCQSPLHLLITDVVMPEMGGRELARQIQALYPDIRILYMSGYSEDAIAKHGVLDQETTFLPKPASIDGLLRKIRDLIG